MLMKGRLAAHTRMYWTISRAHYRRPAKGHENIPVNMALEILGTALDDVTPRHVLHYAGHALRDGIIMGTRKKHGKTA